MAALDEEEGKLLATSSSSSWYGIIKVLFFFFLACYTLFQSQQREEDFGGKFNKRDLLSSLEGLSETHSSLLSSARFMQARHFSPTAHATKASQTHPTHVLPVPATGLQVAIQLHATAAGHRAS